MRNIVVTRVGKESVTSREAFTHYRENAKYRDLEFTNHLFKYNKVINSFYGKVADKLIENEGGVFLKGLGYFSIVMHPKKQLIRVPYNKSGYANFRTQNRLFLPMFFGVVKGNPLMNFWVMDRTFSRNNVKSRLHKALLAGKRYKNYVSTLSSLYLFKK
jgi:hypothetical protein